MVVDTSNKTVSFKPDIQGIRQGLLVITGTLTGEETSFTILCGVNSQYNENADIYKAATNGWVNISDKNIIIHSTYNIDGRIPFAVIRMRLFA